MIIFLDLIVKLGLLTDFKCQFLQLGGVTVPIKEPSVLLGQIDLTSREIREVVIQTAEPVSTRKANDRLVKILNGTYVKEYLEQVAANAT